MRRLPGTLLIFLLVVLATGARPRAASAQIPAADSAAVLLEAADRFAADGETSVARALYRFVAANFPDTPAGREARSRLDTVGQEGTAGGGRVELQVWSTLYGLWLGVAVPGAFGADSPEPYGVGLLLGGPAGFMSGKVLARSRDITEGQARAITLGGTWGTWQGAGWANVMDLGEGEYFCDIDFCEDDGNAEETFAGMVVGGLAGIAIGERLSRKAISPGVATTVNFGALWGTWFGFALGALGDAEGDGLLATSLLGGDVGLLVTAVGAPQWKPSRARARLVSIYGVIGGLGGVGLDLLAQPDDDKVAIGIPLAGSVLGLALGVGLTRDYDLRAGGGGSDGAREAGGAGGAGGALLHRGDRGWSLALPMPYPVLLERDGPRGVRRVPGLGVTLFSARF
jgi:hypothetical protein